MRTFGAQSVLFFFSALNINATPVSLTSGYWSTSSYSASISSLSATSTVQPSNSACSAQTASWTDGSSSNSLSSSVAACSSTIIPSNTPGSSSTLPLSSTLAGVTNGEEGYIGQTSATDANTASSSLAPTSWATTATSDSALQNPTDSNSIIPASTDLSDSLSSASIFSTLTAQGLGVSNDELVEFGTSSAVTPASLNTILGGTVGTVVQQITTFSTANNASGITAKATTSAWACHDWLGNPLPCSCEGAYAASITPTPTTYTITLEGTNGVPIVNVITATLGPPAIEPTGDCNLGCFIGANSVEIIYWPVTTAAPNGTNFSITAAAPTTPYTLVSDGFTFTSPSVYVAYNGLQASAAYLPFGQNLGGGTHSVTVGYPPEALLTSHCNIQYASNSAVQQWATVNYTQLQYPLPNSLVTDCPRNMGAPNVGGATYDPAAFNEMGNPFFSVPGNLTWVDPAWSTCLPISYGVIDPPRKLDKTSVLVAPTPVTTPTSPLGEAAPASSVTPTLAPATSALAVDPGTPISSPIVDAPVVVTGVAQNQGTSNPDAITPGSNPTSTSVDPNDENAAQMSALHQALATQAAVVQPVTPQAAASSPVVMASPSPVVIAGNTATPAANGGVVLASTTYTPGSKATVAGKVYSIGSSVIQDEHSQTYSIQPTSTPVLIAGNSIAKAAGGGVVIASSTYAPGAQAQISGTSISVGSDNIAVAGSTHVLPATPSQTPILVGGQVGQSVARASNGGIIVGGSTTIAPGQQATISNHVISAGLSNAVVDGNNYALPSSAGAVLQQASAQQQAVAQQSTPVVIGGQNIVKAANGGVAIGGTTIAAGAQATVQGHVVSAGASNVVVDGSSSYALPTSAGATVQQTSAPQEAPVLINDQSIARASNGGILIGSSTLAPGVQATIGGHVISAAPANAAGSANVVIDGSTQALATIAGAVLQTSAVQQQQSPVLVGSQSITRASNGGIMVGSITLTPGSQATVAGQTISAAPNNDNVIVDGTTQTLPATAGAVLETPAPTQAPVLIGGESVTRASNGGLVIGGTSTLPPGTQATIAGHTISANANSNNVIIDGTNYALPTTPGAILQTIASPLPTPAQTPPPTPEAVVTLANGALISAGGAAATVSGLLASVLPNDSGIVIGSITYPISPTITPSSVFTLGGQTFTAKPSGFVIGPGENVMPGGSAVTIGGTVVSLDSSGDLQIGSSTIPLVASPTDGGYVAGIAYPSTNRSSTVTPYEGGSSRMYVAGYLVKILAVFWLGFRTVIILL